MLLHQLSSLLNTFSLRPLILALFCAFSLLACAQKNEATRYVFFLHNRFIEEQGLEGNHPQYGRAEYREIVSAFEQAQFTVISDIRPKNADVKTYAQKVTRQIDSLLKRGVRPSHITVIGTSKGGYIAMQVSALAKNPALNFVFIGCCESGSENTAGLDFCGNILSIYEKGDTESCQPLKQRSALPVGRFRELELHTGLKHGYLYKPLKEWMAPSIQWARQEEIR